MAAQQPLDIGKSNWGLAFVALCFWAALLGRSEDSFFRAAFAWMLYILFLVSPVLLGVWLVRRVRLYKQEEIISKQHGEKVVAQARQSTTVKPKGKQS